MELMQKKYYGNKMMIVFEYMIGIIICFLIPLSLRNSIIYYFFALPGTICLGLLMIGNLMRTELIIDQEKIISINAGTPGTFQIMWDEIESIRYYPVFCSLSILLPEKRGIAITCTIKDYKHAWKDIIEQARAKNPTIEILASTIRRLEKAKII